MPRSMQSERWVQARVSDDTHRGLRVAAAAHDLSIADIVRHLLDHYLSHALRDLSQSTPSN